ncbi:MAG: hypothetical protein HQL37_04840 [Alphaproteobacteria bacterium]|nr:hypothetical protein [Alphaproteobacteria bacterium]
MTERFCESEMWFIPHPNMFRIEKSKIYQKNQQDLTMAEFLLLRDATPPEIGQSLWIVEAKTTFPNPNNPNNPLGHFDKSIGEICTNLVNAMLLGLGIYMGGYVGGADELPEAMRDMDLKAIKIKLVLIIKNHQERWLVVPRRALEKEIRRIIKIFGPSLFTVAVVNEKQAQDFGLVEMTLP